MTNPPPFGTEGVTRGLAGLPGPLASDADPALRRAHDAADLEIIGLGDASRPAPSTRAQGGGRGWWLRLRRRFRRG